MNDATPSEREQRQILLVEDNDADAQLLIVFFEIQGFADGIHWVKDGEEALDFVFKRGNYVEAPNPDLVLLDLNLPKVHGLEVLKIIRSDEKIRDLTVIVMSTSSSDSDRKASYELSAKSFVTKPTDLTQYEKLVKQILTVELNLHLIPNQKT